MRGESVRSRSRRGSMQLGIETVVILIIAIVLLGSMIYFIQTLIKPEGFVPEIGCGKTIIPNDAVPVKPESLSVTLGENNQVALCVYNDYGKSLDAAKVQFARCAKPDGTVISAPSSVFRVTDLGWDYKRNQFITHAFQIQTTSAVSEADLGEWLCNIQISAQPGPISDTNPGVGPVPLTVVVE